MSGDSTFDAAWLRLREPFDRPARAAAASRLRLAQVFESLRPSDGRPWRVIDLGCGIGATVHAVSPLLQGSQQWLLVDHDARLLEQTPSSVGNAVCRTLCLNLATQLHRLPLDGCTLVTASALLDLVGIRWLESLVSACARARVALYLSLNVDGGWWWQPAQRGDALAQRLFALHQLRDKGFGAALGPRAAAVAATACRAAGYRVRSARSDWRLDAAADPAATELKRRLIEGMAAAAIEQAPEHAAGLHDWRDRRLRAATGTSLRVGHVDLIALPPAL